MTSTPDQPEWWKRLSSADQEFLRRLMGDAWPPKEAGFEEMFQMFEATRQRIKAIEQRALGNLRGDEGGAGQDG